METIKQRYTTLCAEIEATANQSALYQHTPQLIAVSKRQPKERISALLELGHQQFGENQVQEAEVHWTAQRAERPDLRLHLIGPLQSNKVRAAVALFDVIHTVDREKIARAIRAECDAQNRNISCFAQVNIGEEPQKSGLLPADLPDFLKLCHDEFGLAITGLMAIPPAKTNPAPYFALLRKLADRHDLPELSMGMSNDWTSAIRFGASYIRLGTAVFGPRNS